VVTVVPVVFNASVSSGGIGVQGATVRFYVDGTLVGSGTSGSSGSVSYSLPSLPVGSHSWYASAEKSGYTSSSSLTWSLIYSTSVEIGDGFEPDNSFTQFSSLTVTTSLQAQFRSIYPTNDNDYIRFFVDNNSLGTYVFYTSSSIDTFGNLYDSAQNQLAWNDDYGGDSDFRIAYKISISGYYTLKVSEFGIIAGPYTLYYQYEP
jgi:hypothetical protein